MWQCKSLVAVLLAALAATASAQPMMKAVGVFALLGDGVEVSTSTDAPRDTRIENTARQTVEFKGIGFDLIALKVAREAINREQPAALVSVFRSAVAMSTADQRALAAGARNAELPAWMVKTIEDGRLSHVLLITRLRGPMDARTGDGVDIGRGTVEGMGFHIETLFNMRNSTTGAVSTGLLAPHTLIRLQLMDTMSGDIVAQHDIRSSFAFAAAEAQLKSDPWTFMPNDEKVVTLRGMVEQGMTRGMAALLAKP